MEVIAHFKPIILQSDPKVRVSQEQSTVFHHFSKSRLVFQMFIMEANCCIYCIYCIFRLKTGTWCQPDLFCQKSYCQYEATVSSGRCFNRSQISHQELLRCLCPTTSFSNSMWLVGYSEGHRRLPSLHLNRRNSAKLPENHLKLWNTGLFVSQSYGNCQEQSQNLNFPQTKHTLSLIGSCGEASYPPGPWNPA